MAETKFTPGPWAYRPREFDDWGLVRGGPDGFPVAQARAGRMMIDGEDNEHRRKGTDPYGANAHLIAAAPDLFKALEDMLPAFVANFTYDDERAVRAFAALAKARGEA